MYCDVDTVMIPLKTYGHDIHGRPQWGFVQGDVDVNENPVTITEDKLQSFVITSSRSTALFSRVRWAPVSALLFMCLEEFCLFARVPRSAKGVLMSGHLNSELVTTLARILILKKR